MKRAKFQYFILKIKELILFFSYKVENKIRESESQPITHYQPPFLLFYQNTY